MVTLIDPASTFSMSLAIDVEVLRNSPDYGERCDPLTANQVGGPYNCQHFIYLTFPGPANYIGF